MKKKILILGYSKIKIKKFIFKLKKNNNITIVNRSKIPKLKILKKFDLIVSYGLREIVKPNIINKLNRKIINLHISYLPYNRGAHPNFWSWVNNTPKGITIHEVSKKIDAGNVIFQKKINIPLRGMTFYKSYKILRQEIEKLFINNFGNIIAGNYKSRRQKKGGSFHVKNNLPRNIGSWKISILNYKKKSQNGI
tara:strand:- start:4 stop:585 length:582 start_codon:yes stop_codon:yes gene_type:complete